VSDLVTLGIILLGALAGLLACHAITVSVARAFGIPLERDKAGHLVMILSERWGRGR
jgi:hypothetical protein